MKRDYDEVLSEHSKMLSALKDILSINWRDGLEGLDRPTDRFR